MSKILYAIFVLYIMENTKMEFEFPAMKISPPESCPGGGRGHACQPRWRARGTSRQRTAGLQY